MASRGVWTTIRLGLEKVTVNSHEIGYGLGLGKSARVADAQATTQTMAMARYRERNRFMADLLPDQKSNWGD